MPGHQPVSWDCLSRAHVWAGQVCGELETSPVTAVEPGHGLTELRGAERGLSAMGRDRGCHREAGRAGEACLCSPGPGSFFLFWISVKLAICYIGQHLH